MTAETLTSAQAASTIPAKRSGGSGVLHAAYGTYEVAANVEDGDIFEMCRVPPNARIVGGWVYADDLDVGTEALDMDLGWAANGGSGTFDSATPTGLGNFGTWTGDPFATPSVSASTGTVIPLAGVLADGDCPNFTRETVIQVEANTAADSFVAGGLSVVVLYIVPAAAS